MNPILEDKEFDARLAKLAEQHKKRQAIFASGYWNKEAIAQRYATPQSQDQPSINWNRLKTLHLQTDQTTQINSIALNLTRIQALAESNTGSPIAQHLIRESQYLIEWTVPTLNADTESQVVTELVELQKQLSQWKLGWADIWPHSGERASIATQAQSWCQRLRQNPALQNR